MSPVGAISVTFPLKTGKKLLHPLPPSIVERVIAIECIISARILKARIAIESNYVAFVVAYAPTEEVPEGQKAKYKAALNNTVGSVPAREYVYVLTDAHARTGMRCKGGREAGSKVLREFDRDVLNENRKLLLGFAEGNKLAFSEHFLLHPQKWRVLHVPKRQPQQETNTFGLYPDKRSGPSTDPLRSIPPAPFRSTRIGSQSRIREHPHSTQVRTKREERDSTKETPKTADLRWLMADPNLRCHVAHPMVAALPPIPDGTCISDIATDMLDVMLTTAAELAPRSKRPRGAQGWWAGPGVEVEINAA